MSPQQLKNIVEAALLAADHALSVDRLLALFSEHEGAPPSRDEIRDALALLAEEYQFRGIELKQVSSGYRIQVRADFSLWISRLREEKPARYSRALLETLALIVYRQPITRAEIEDIRGVSVSTPIIRTLEEREWIRVVGHRDVPGRPALYGSTRAFLDDFNLSSLDQLPTLAEVRDLEDIQSELNLQAVDLASAPLADDGVVETAEVADEGQTQNSDSIQERGEQQ
ncbi:MAG: SMC-Scp complex subunit ScpB [Gammaproteobacteria bacterium]|nr:SMC-Scp complex subunit ScpB [Gammaproteobacteria bacterium]